MSEIRTYTPQQVAKSNRMAAVDKASNTAKIREEQAKRDKDHKAKILKMQQDNRKAREAHAKKILDSQRQQAKSKTDIKIATNANRKKYADLEAKKRSENVVRRRTAVENAVERQKANNERRRQEVASANQAKTQPNPQKHEAINAPSNTVLLNTFKGFDFKNIYNTLKNVDLSKSKVLNTEAGKKMTELINKSLAQLFIKKQPINLDNLLLDLQQIVKKIDHDELKRMIPEVKDAQGNPIETGMLYKIYQFSSVEDITEIKNHPDFKEFLSTDIGKLLNNQNRQKDFISKIQGLNQVKNDDELINGIKQISTEFFPNSSKEFNSFLDMIVANKDKYAGEDQDNGKTPTVEEVISSFKTEKLTPGTLAQPVQTVPSSRPKAVEVKTPVTKPVEENVENTLETLSPKNEQFVQKLTKVMQLSNIPNETVIHINIFIKDIKSNPSQEISEATLRKNLTNIFTSLRSENGKPIIEQILKTLSNKPLESKSVTKVNFALKFNLISLLTDDFIKRINESK